MSEAYEEKKKKLCVNCKTLLCEANAPTSVKVCEDWIVEKQRLDIEEGKRIGREEAKVFIAGLGNITIGQYEDTVKHRYKQEGYTEAIAEINKGYAKILESMPEYVNEATSFKLATKVQELLKQELDKLKEEL